MSPKRKISPRHDSTDLMGEFESICEALRALLQGEYERGTQETAQQIMGLMGANTRKDSSGYVSPGRAPRGAAKAFVVRCLQDGPIKISEIRARAKSPIEKILSYQTVRLELLRGLKDKRYKKVKDRFSLAD